MVGRLLKVGRRGGGGGGGEGVVEGEVDGEEDEGVLLQVYTDDADYMCNQG